MAEGYFHRESTRKSFRSFALLAIGLLLMWPAVLSWGLTENIKQVPEIVNQQLLWLLPVYTIGFLLVLLVTRGQRSWRDLLAVVMIYASFFYAVYMQVMTGQINNPDFNEQAFLRKELYNSHQFWAVGAILVLGAFLIKSRRSARILAAHLPALPSFYGLGGVMALDMMAHPKVLSLYQSTLLKLLEKGKVLAFLESLWSASLPLLCVFVALCLLGLQGARALLRNQASLGGAVLMSLMLALWVNYHLQLGYQAEETLLGQYIFEGASTYQLTFFAVVFLFIYVVTNRFLLSTLLIGGLSTLMVLVNQMKVVMRGEPLLITDFVWLKELGLLLGFVDQAMLYQALLGLTLLVVGYLLFRRHLFHGRVCRHLFQRSLLLVGMLGLATLTFSVFSLEKDHKIPAGFPVISDLNNETNINWLGFTANARYKSLAFVWTKQLVTPVMEKPEGYNQQTMMAIADKYQQLAAQLNEGRSHRIDDQTVIYVLSESFSDLLRLPNMELSQDNIPFIRDLMTKTTSGTMHSDGYGGGTANMEFQSLVGLPMYNLSPSVSTIYTEVVPKMSYLPSISNLYDAEQRHVIHLESGANYARSTIYRQLDFATFTGLSHVDTIAKDLAYVGVFPSDATSYRYVLDRLNQSPQFFSVITMQNHMPWSESQPESLKASHPMFSSDKNEELTSYARLLSHTDQATKEFLEQLASREEKISVVFYGDHLPGLYPQELFADQPELQYQTDFFIWSNFDTQRTSYDVINSSDLTAVLLETTQSKVSPYYALLTEVLKKAGLNQVALTPEGEQIAQDLKLVQYDLVRGKGYLRHANTFFEIGE